MCGPKLRSAVDGDAGDGGNGEGEECGIEAGGEVVGARLTEPVERQVAIR